VDSEINEKAKEMLEGFLSFPHKDISAVGGVCVYVCVCGGRGGAGGDRENIFLYGARNDISYYEISVIFI
jgi:hypothetical protein